MHAMKRLQGIELEQNKQTNNANEMKMQCRYSVLTSITPQAVEQQPPTLH